MTIVEMGAALRRKQVSAEELVRDTYAKIAAENPRLNAFLCDAGEAGIERARALDAERAAGRDRGPLHGIPVGVKDNFLTKGLRTTNGSKIFADFVPEENAAAVDRLEAAGAVVVGKTNMHELAYGITSNNPHFGAVRNHHDVTRIPGGSSGGSGTAVAAGIVPAALGSDTGGSIRVPASFCGCVGLKPTYGLVDRRGCLPLGLTLDHVGPLTATVEDAGLVLEALCGAKPPSYGPIGDLRIGVPENFYFDQASAEVAAAVRSVIEKSGARLVPVRVPNIDGLNVVSRVILFCEASAIYEKWLDRRELFGADVLTLIDQGRLVPGTDYVQAQRLRSVYRRQFEELFRDIDCLATPTTPTTAPRLEESNVRILTTSLVRGINVVGLPAISVPCGKDGNGLPIGVQLVARWGAEGTLLRAAARF
jgi:aspartyl-tRNA(Asn)/glutamyl-tRNA(Gln) amidotransferase subunit A